ncbi:hypothetical protein ACDQ55_01855 [Chitinophaga sp. 30R24]|uniref:hypothetical protein n=1 Tax=Chitinophaga sp. 30R24 TaxID=3248838 RepID=UPI003B914EF8
MKRKPFGLALLLATVAGASMMTSCKKDNQKKDISRPVSASGAVPFSSTLVGVLGTNHGTADTILLTNGITWHLNGLVYVDSADVLIIEPGTTIVGDLSADPSVAGGGLIITKNAKILADGTPANPIVFTSAAAVKTPGDWSGVVLLGNAPTNVPTTTRVEGVTSVSPADATFGGNNPADNSGILRFVRIEYAGFALSLNNELNGLTLAGVGNGTIIDYVEVFKANDDAFEWFGGTVNASHLLAIDAYDDMFDTDNGYSGTISYALGLSDTTRADQSQSNGFESDNNASGTTATPNTHAKYNNITIVGLPNYNKAAQTYSVPGGLIGTYGRAAHLRRNTEFEIKKSIFIGFNYGLSFDITAGSTYDKFIGGISNASGNYVQAYTYPYATELSGVFTGITAPAGNFGYTGTLTNPNVAQISLLAPFNRTSVGAANFITNVGSAADNANAGAFPGGIDWTIVNGSYSWTRYK